MQHKDYRVVATSARLLGALCRDNAAFACVSAATGGEHLLAALLECCSAHEPLVRDAALHALGDLASLPAAHFVYIPLTLSFVMKE